MTGLSDPNRGLRAWRASAAAHSYAWTARHAQGRLVHGHCRAGGISQVRAQLRREGLVPVSVTMERPPRQRAIRARDVVLFTRQLATLLGAGVPLLQCLQVMRQGLSHAAMVRLIEAMESELEQGQAFSSVLRRRPAVFPPLYVHLVEAGEASGRLDVLLQRLAADLEKAELLKAKLRSALVYPVVVLSVAALVVTVVMVAVVPTFEHVFTSFGAELPLPTQWVMGISRALVTHGWWLILGSAAFAAWELHRWRRSEGLRRRTERAALATPLLGDLMHRAAVARWSRTLAGLLAAGLPLVEAMGAVRGAAGHYLYADACTRLREELSRGSSLHAAMGATGLFSPMVLQMCAVGEESGALDQMLAKVAEAHEREVDEQVSALASLLEPAIILLLGVVVGGLVVALYLPIFQMGQIT